MYTVFINDHLIKCTDLEENLQQDINQIELHQPSLNKITEFIEMALKETKQTYALILRGWDSKKLIPLLKDYYQFIIAAGGIVEFENKFLLIHRLKKWDLPKGKMEIGEDPQMCALREVEEECNVTNLSIQSLLPSSFHIYKDREGDVVLKETVWFSMQAKDEGSPKPQTEEGIETVRWMNKEEIKSLIPHTYASLRPLFYEISS